MSKNGNRYSEEFKQQIVDLHNAGNFVSYLSREYGVVNVTIYKRVGLVSTLLTQVQSF